MKPNRVVKTKDGRVGVVTTDLSVRIAVQDETNNSFWVYADDVESSDEPLHAIRETVEVTCPCCNGSGRSTTQRTFVIRKEK